MTYKTSGFHPDDFDFTGLFQFMAVNDIESIELRFVARPSDGFTPEAGTVVIRSLTDHSMPEYTGLNTGSFVVVA